MSKASRLRALIDSGEHFIAAEAYTALTGRIVEQVGFKAAYLGGHACSAMHYAIPDNGMFSQVEQIDQASRIANAIDIPLIADADTLGETVADAYHFTRRYIQQGIAGIHIEDEINPKHSTFANGLCSIADMQARIDAAVRARREHGDLVIIARCDELIGPEKRGGGSNSLEEAIRRGKAYAEAGADFLVYPTAAPELQAAIIAAVQLPLCTLTRVLPDTAFMLSTGWGWGGAARLHLERARQLLETGTVTIDADFPEKGELLREPFYDRLVADWARGTGRETR